MNEKLNIAIIILAAGESKRMIGKIKQLLPWKHTTLLGNAIQQAKLSKANKVYLVLGAHQEAIKANLEVSEIEYIVNQDWQNGIGSSIAVGFETILGSKMPCDAVLIMLADQPLMDTDYLNELIHVWDSTNKSIVATQYNGKAGVPAIFGKVHFEELRKLNHDQGAKHIIDKSDILVVSSQGKEVDVDTWEAYQNLL